MRRRLVLLANMVRDVDRALKGRQLHILAILAVFIGMTATKGIAFGRDIVVAAVFGASTATDSFLLAWIVPNLIWELLIDGAVTLIVAPHLVRLRDPAQRTEFRGTLGILSGALLMVSIFPVIVCFILAPWLIQILSPSSPPEKVQEVVMLTRIMLLGVPLQTFSSIAGSGLNILRVFLVPSLLPASLAAGVIVVVLAGGSALGIQALAYGTLAGATIGAIMAAIFLARHQVLSVPRFDPMSDMTRQLFSRLPLAIPQSGLGMASMALDWGFASSFAAGSVSGLYFAHKLYYLPYWLIVVPCVTTLIPEFSRLAQERQHRDLMRSAVTTAVLLVITALPVILIVEFGAPLLVRTAFERGTFDAEATELTAGLLRTYMVGLPANMLSVLCFSAAWPLLGARALASVTLLGLATTALFDATLSRVFGLTGIALSYVLVQHLLMATNGYLLWRATGCQSLPSVRELRAQAVNRFLRVRRAILIFRAGA